MLALTDTREHYELNDDARRHGQYRINNHVAVSYFHVHAQSRTPLPLLSVVCVNIYDNRQLMLDQLLKTLFNTDLFYTPYRLFLLKSLVNQPGGRNESPVNVLRENVQNSGVKHLKYGAI